MRLQVIFSPVSQSLFLRRRFFKLHPVLNQPCRNLATRINHNRLERIISQNGRRLLEAKSALQELQTKVEKMEDSMLRQPLIYDNAAEASEKDRAMDDLVGPRFDRVTLDLNPNLRLSPTDLKLALSEFNVERFKDSTPTKDSMPKDTKFPRPDADGNNFVNDIHLDFSQIECAADVDAAIEKANIKKESDLGNYFRLLGLKLLRLQAK